MNHPVVSSSELLSDKELVCLAKSGDTGAFAVLSERYKTVLFYRAGRYSNIAGVDVEDFFQEGMLALFRAVKSYDARAGIMFKTYAITCINNSMSTAIKSHMKNIGGSLGISIDGLDEQALLDEAAQICGEHPVEDAFLEKEDTRLRARIIEGALSPYERRILALYLDGYSYRQISGKLSVAGKSVDNALQRIRRKLRAEL